MVVASGTFLSTGLGCSLVEGHSCHEIGCAAGVFVTIAPESGMWAEGSYRLELSLDDDSRGGCDIAIPADLPANGSVTSLRCGDGVDVMVQQRAQCMESREGGGVSLSCQPLANQYELNLSAYGEPVVLELTLTRDGAPLLSENLELDYEESRPNGPDCAPICRQAHLELAFDE